MSSSWALGGMSLRLADHILGAVDHKMMFNRFFLQRLAEVQNIARCKRKKFSNIDCSGQSNHRLPSSMIDCSTLRQAEIENQERTTNGLYTCRETVCRCLLEVCMRCRQLYKNWRLRRGGACPPSIRAPPEGNLVCGPIAFLMTNPK